MPVTRGEGRIDPARLAALVATVLLWLVAAGPPAGQPVAGWVGMLTFHLTAAALIRWLYIRVQKPRPPIVTPALFAIAAGIALLGRFGPSA